jgi:hypothetical protein
MTRPRIAMGVWDYGTDTRRRKHVGWTWVCEKHRGLGHVLEPIIGDLVAKAVEP